jgi:helix-turn-helix protein
MDKEIGRINKNPNTDIVVRIDDFGDRRGLTIREYVSSDKYTGFTKSGVRILAGDFKKFKEMINSISEKEMEEAVSSGSSEKPQEKVRTEKPGHRNQEELPDY